jgi:ubiquinone/menaquinone biosynthesis C-methylase UbiE
MFPRWFIKTGFHLLYHQMAWSYDWVAWVVSFGQWSMWRRMALQFMQPGPTLELAYGTGAFFIDMLDNGYQPVGIDISPYMAQIAGKRLQKNKRELRLNQARAQALPFPDHTFVNIVATFPTDYIMEDETLAEIHRVLRDPTPNSSSRLVVVAEGQLRGPWPMRPFIDWLYKVTGQRDTPLEKPMAPLAKHNFTARWESVTHDGVTARLIIAEKRLIES